MDEPRGHEALAGQPAFPAQQPSELIVAILNGRVTPLRAIRADLSPDVEAVVTRALETRLDLVRARLDVANADTTVRFSRNQTLPDLRVALGYTGNSLAGTRLIRTGGFPGTITGSEVIPFSTALDQVRQRARGAP